ncbi:Glycosyltransferase 1 domain-containing protein 1 [Durusdinium trenchii]|uniref:Glycosyltransferase 1 domain-containing protein 1 n=1 Tax=Durusdinium trenchii TaxID=1381693 RepID=A0ABP0QFZ3_9DINO
MGNPFTIFEPLVDTAEVMAQLRDEVACRRLPNISQVRSSALYLAGQEEDPPIQFDFVPTELARGRLQKPKGLSPADDESEAANSSEADVIFVTPWYGHFAGGAEAAARSFAEHLARRGWNVEVLTTCCRDPYSSWWKSDLPEGSEVVNGVTVRRFPVNPEGEHIFHQLNAKNTASGLFDEAEQKAYVTHSINSDALVKYAAEHAHDKLIVALPYTQGVVYSLVTALPGQVCVMSCLHDEPQMYWSTTGTLLDSSRRIFFLTEEEKDLAIRHYGRAVGRRLVESPVVGVGTELPAGIDELLADEEQVDSIIEDLNLPSKFFVYLGRKDVGKNVPQLVQYFRTYRAQGGQAHLLFLGGGVAELVPHDVGMRDLGYLPEDQKFAILSRALGLINLSENESFSLAIMEAWLCGVPVVVSANCEITAAHCLHSGGGVAVSTPTEFVTMLRTLESDSLRHAMGAAGRRYTRKHYSWDSVLDRLLRGAARGIGVCTRMIVEQAVRHDPTKEWIVNVRCESDLNWFSPEVRGQLTPVVLPDCLNLGDFRASTRRYTGLIQELIDDRHIDAYWNPNPLMINVLLPGRLSNVTTFATVYDLIPWVMREWYLDRWPQHLQHEYLRRLKALPRLIDHMLFPSEHSRNDYIDFDSSVADKSSVVYLAADHHRFAPVNGSPIQNRDPLVLYTGGFDVRKNMEGALEAFAHLVNGDPDHFEQLKLCIVCSFGPESLALFERRARVLGIGDRLVMPDRCLAGLEHAQKFTWSNTAAAYSRTFVDVHIDRASKSIRRRPRVAYVTPWPPHRTGVAHYAQVMASHLSKRVDLTLYVENPQEVDPPLYGMQVRGLTDLPSEAEQYDTVLYHIGNNTKFHRAIYQLAWEIPGVIVLHDYNINPFLNDAFLGTEQADLYYSAALEGYGIPREAIPPHGLDTFEYPMSVALAKRSQATIVHSAWVREELQEVPNVHVIPHGSMDHPKEMSRAALAPLRDRLGIDPTEFVVSSLGFVHRLKRVDVVLEAVKTLVDRGFPIRFVIGGSIVDPSLKIEEKIHELGLESNVTVSGYLSEEDLEGVVSLSDVVINLRCPSLGEASGTLMRAFAHGKACIVSNYQQYAELPTDACWHVDVDELEIPQLVAYLERLVRDPDVRTQLGRNAKNYVDHYTSFEFAAKLYAFAVGSAGRPQLRHAPEIIANQLRFDHDWVETSTAVEAIAEQPIAAIPMVPPAPPRAPLTIRAAKWMLRPMWRLLGRGLNPIMNRFDAHLATVFNAVLHQRIDHRVATLDHLVAVRDEMVTYVGTLNGNLNNVQRKLASSSLTREIDDRLNEASRDIARLRYQVESLRDAVEMMTPQPEPVVRGNRRKDRPYLSRGRRGNRDAA